MKLFKSKESFKEKVDSNNNWKSQAQEWYDFRVTYFKIIVRIWRKMLGFVRKNVSFYPKDACLFSVFFI